MLKKGIIIGIILITISAVVLISYHYLKTQTAPTTNLVKAIPINSPAFIECKNYNSLILSLQGSSYWEELQEIEFFGNLSEKIRALDTLFNNNASVKELLSNQPVIISTHLTGKKNYDFIFLIGLSPLLTEESALQYIENLITGKGAKSVRNYDNRSIYDIKLNSDSDIEDFSYTVVDDIFILSFSSILVEDAIRQINSGESLVMDQEFKKVSETAGINVDANFYINYQTFGKFFSIFLNDNYSSYLNKIDHFANWSELDLTLKDKHILLNGFTYSNDSVSNFLNLFYNQNPVKTRIEDILPANTSVMLWLGLSDFETYYKDRLQYLQNTNSYESFQAKYQKLKSDYEIDLVDFYKEIFENELALVYTDINILDVKQNAYIIMKTKSKSLAEEKYIDILIRYAEENDIKIETLSDLCKIDNEISFPVYKMPYNNLIGLVFGDVFNEIETHYFTFIDNYIVFSETKKGLKSFIHSNILQKTLNTDINYNEFKDNLSAKSNFLFYSNPNMSYSLFRTYLNNSLKIALDSNLNTIKKFQSFAIQVFPSKNMIFNNIILKYSSEVKEKPRTVWESHLDTTIRIKPKFVINHNTNEKEIFIQDLNNSVYLINNTGRILWKIKLDEPIISEIVQVDFYKNKKLQYLFNTKSKIYILDRLGNNVEKYPISLREHATNGLSLFDYENNRDYRIFIACKDKKVYAYDIEGKILKGWEFDLTDNYVYQPIQHFKIEDKDYIVFADSIKTYILDRRGNERVKIEKYFTRSLNNNFFLDQKTTNKDNRLITTDISGNIIYVYFTGKVEVKNLHDNLSKEHLFDYVDIDGDGKEDFIFINKNEVDIYNQRKEKIFEYTFTSEISSSPVLYIFPNNNRKIGFVLKEENEIYLFDNDGEIYEGFPLKGCTPFSVGHISNSSSMFNLFVGSPDGFLYNYEVH